MKNSVDNRMSRMVWKSKWRWRMVALYWGVSILGIGLAFIFPLESCSKGGFMTICIPIALILPVVVNYPVMFLEGYFFDYMWTLGGVWENIFPDWLWLVTLPIMSSVFYFVLGLGIEWLIKIHYSKNRAA